MIARIIENPETARGDAAREFALALITKRLRLQHFHQEQLLAIQAKDPVLNELLQLGSTT